MGDFMAKACQLLDDFVEVCASGPSKDVPPIAGVLHGLPPVAMQTFLDAYEAVGRYDLVDVACRAATTDSMCPLLDALLRRNPALAAADDGDDGPPMGAAAYCDARACLALLLRVAPGLAATVQGGYNTVPLGLARSAEAVRMLLAAAPGSTRTPSPHGRECAAWDWEDGHGLPAHFIVSFGTPAALAALASADPGALFARGVLGRTALHFAAAVSDGKGNGGKDTDTMIGVVLRHLPADAAAAAECLLARTDNATALTVAMLYSPKYSTTGPCAARELAAEMLRRGLDAAVLRSVEAALDVTDKDEADRKKDEEDAINGDDAAKWWHAKWGNRKTERTRNRRARCVEILALCARSGLDVERLACRVPEVRARVQDALRGLHALPLPVELRARIALRASLCLSL